MLTDIKKGRLEEEHKIRYRTPRKDKLVINIRILVWLLVVLLESQGTSRISLPRTKLPTAGVTFAKGLKLNGKNRYHNHGESAFKTSSSLEIAD